MFDPVAGPRTSCAAHREESATTERTGGHQFASRFKILGMRKGNRREFDDRPHQCFRKAVGEVVPFGDKILLKNVRQNVAGSGRCLAGRYRDGIGGIAERHRRKEKRRFERELFFRLRVGNHGAAVVLAPRGRERQNGDDGKCPDDGGLLFDEIPNVPLKTGAGGYGFGRINDAAPAQRDDDVNFFIAADRNAPAHGIDFGIRGNARQFRKAATGKQRLDFIEEAHAPNAAASRHEKHVGAELFNGRREAADDAFAENEAGGEIQFKRKHGVVRRKKFGGTNSKGGRPGRRHKKGPEPRAFVKRECGLFARKTPVKRFFFVDALHHLILAGGFRRTFAAAGVETVIDVFLVGDVLHHGVSASFLSFFGMIDDVACFFMKGNLVGNAFHGGVVGEFFEFCHGFSGFLTWVRKLLPSVVASVSRGGDGRENYPFYQGRHRRLLSKKRKGLYGKNAPGFSF